MHGVTGMFRRLEHDPRSSPLDGIPGGRPLGRALEGVYLWGLRRDRRRQLAAPPHRLGVPVISIGNLTVGGTGKTPVVEAFARGWLRRGGRPGILSRGYRGGWEGNDEYRLLRRRLPGVPHFADRDRRAAGEALLRAHPDVDLILLDDGYQHRRLHRDLDLVLIDATRPFGGGRCLPAGWLREPWTDLDRASSIVLTRADQISGGALRQLERFLEERFPGRPRCTATRILEGVRTPDGGTRVEPAGAAGERLGAFCALGNPQAFFRSLRSRGLELAWTRTFRDHHAYGAADLERIRAEARRAGVTRLLTTEKDGVKLEALPGFQEGSPAIDQVRIRVELPVDELIDLLP
jgi:tetraacyldisaccharide 4'-kinase